MNSLKIAYSGAMSLDPVDLKILEALQNDGACSANETARAAGLSPTPFWRRYRRLLADGLVKERVVLLDEKKLGLGVAVMASIRLRNHDGDALRLFEEAVLNRAEVVECYSMSGDSDFLLRIVTKSIEEYESFLKAFLLRLPGVGNINSHFVLKQIKRTTKLPLGLVGGGDGHRVG